MGNVIDLGRRLRKPQPSWVATVTIDADGAELTGFWGVDGRETSERCAHLASELDKLSAQLRLMAAATQEPQP